MTGWMVTTHPGEVCQDLPKRSERAKGRDNDRGERVRGGTPSRSNGAKNQGRHCLTKHGAEGEHFCAEKGGLITIRKSELKDYYSMMYPDYPDIVTVPQLQKMLGISRGLAYRLVRENEIHGVKVGNALRVPKVSIINYVLSDSSREGAVM